MKLKVLHHDPADYAVSGAGRLTPVVRSSASHLHPFVKDREAVRATNAAKLERMFAKPLVGVLSGHTDGLYCMTRARTMVAPLFSGSFDGEIRFWNAGHKRCFGYARAHGDTRVTGITVSHDDRLVYSCGLDRTVKSWAFDREAATEFGNDVERSEIATHGLRDELFSGGSCAKGAGELKPAKIYQTSAAVNAIDHNWKKFEFATASDSVVDIWDPIRSQPRQSFEWGCEGVYTLKYNPAETNILGATTKDNAVMLFDIRAGSAVKKLTLQMRSNALCFNPREPQNFTVANEDTNLYTFDMRKMDAAWYVHKGHVQAVMDLDYNPTGLELVSASYDKTVRIFNFKQEKSREVYFTKRMQRLQCVRYSGDGRFIFTGSEDMNIRMWKNQASEKLGVISEREKRAMAYRETLKEKFAQQEDVKLIKNHRHVPKFIKNQGKQRADHFEARKRKEKNVEVHSKKEKALTDKERIVRKKED